MLMELNCLDGSSFPLGGRKCNLVCLFNASWLLTGDGLFPVSLGSHAREHEVSVPFRAQWLPACPPLLWVGNLTLSRVLIPAVSEH